MAVMSDFTIRPARPGDARGIARLDVETWRTTYAGVLSTAYLVGLSERRREAGWRGVILREPRDVRVAVGSNGVILGFGSCGPNRGDRSFTGEVFTLYVAPDWQNRGIGRRLLIALFRRLVAAGRRSAILWVLRENPSRFFYERLGAQQVSRKPIAVGGYLLTGLSVGFYGLAGGWVPILLARTAGWLARGVRGPARDAMLADAVPREAIGRLHEPPHRDGSLPSVQVPASRAGREPHRHAHHDPPLPTPDLHS